MLPKSEWGGAAARFELQGDEQQGVWHSRGKSHKQWRVAYRGLPFYLRLSTTRHVGVFPEQAPHWDWMCDLIAQASQPPRVLNLFGYTGVASLLAARAGAQVTHVDASKPTVAWARENQKLAGLDESPIRWVVEDALKYCEREVKRGARYEGILLDPPPFGRGPGGEVWKFGQSMPRLWKLCRALFSERPLFLILTAYTSQTTLPQLVADLQGVMAGHEGEIGMGRALLAEQSGGRILEPATFVRWSATKL
jgi:23S rRNA (cytosine1962-C5)-methyltransferase